MEINPGEIKALKLKSGKDIVIIGSASIVQAFANLDLADEYQIILHPLILGVGKPLFSNLNARAG